MSSGDMRKVLESAFEPHGDGYLYHRNIFVPGVPVSAVERENYIQNWTPTATSEFHRRIVGRLPEGRARGFTGAKAILRAQPDWFAPGYLLAGAANVMLAWYPTPTLPSLVHGALAVILVTLGIAAFYVRKG